MSDMELYDPEFPCDSDLLEGSDAAANQDTDANIIADANITIAAHDECFHLQLSSIELPPEPYRPELFQNAVTNKSPNKETSKSPNKETSKSPNKETSKSPDKETSKSPNKETCKSPNKETSKSPDKETGKSPDKECSSKNKETSKSPNKETSKSPDKETRKSPNKETYKSPDKERSSKDCVKAADSTDYPKKSNAIAVVENTIIDKIEDTEDGDDAIEDDARYRDELKKLTAVRHTHTKESESKAAKDVPLEIYLGPSVGFRVDLTMNKSRKLSVESVAKKRHDDMFERPSPERRGRAKSDAKSVVESPSASKTDFRSSSKTPVKSDVRDEESPGEVSRQKKSASRNEYTLVESGSDSDRDLRALLRKREAENQALLVAVPRIVKMKHMDRKSEESLVNRLDETSSSRKSRPHDNDRDDVESSNRKTTDYGGGEPKRSKHRRHEAETERMEFDHAERKDGSSSRKSNTREKEKDTRDNRDSKRSNSSKHARDEYEQSSHRSEERARGAGRSELKELSYGTNKSRDRERPIESDTDPDHRSRRKRRNSRSASNEHKKKPRKSKSRSPKRKRDRSKSGDRRRTKDGRSKSQESRKKKSESKPKNDDRHLTPPPPRHKKEHHRHHRSRSKTPMREPEAKKGTRTTTRHSDLKESSYYVEQWAFDEVAAPTRSSEHRSKSKQQPSLRELQERSTSLLEACMKTRYENQGSGDDRRRSRKHRRQDKHDFEVQTLNFGRLPSGKPGSVDYITLSDSDEGIVWSDNEETTYANYSCLPVRNEPSSAAKKKKKKQKYEEIYSGRGGSLQCVENRLPSRSPPPKPSSKSRSQKEPSLSPSKIIAINLKRRENSWRKKMEKLKITKDVSRSSLEPGEIEDGSSLDNMSDNNGVIEDTMEPTRRMVSLVDDTTEVKRRRPGDKVPIQIHVITSHGDGRGGGGKAADEIVSTTDCDENVTGFVTTTDDAVGTDVFPTERGDQKMSTLPGPEEEEEEGMCGDEHDSDEKELAGDLVICTGNSPMVAEKLLSKAERDELEAQLFERSVAEEFEKRMMAEATMTKNAERQTMFGVSVPAAVDAKSKDIFEFVTRRNDDSSRSPKAEAIPGLGDASPASPVMESEIEPPLVNARNLSSFYHIKKKTNLEQTSLDLIVEPAAAVPVKAQGPHPASPRKALIQKDELSKASSSPLKSPSVESLAAASHQMPSTLPQSVAGLSKTAVPSFRIPDGPLQIDSEPLPSLPSDRTPTKISIPKPTPPSNAYMLNQNTIVDLLASFPSTSSSLTQQPVSAAAVVTSHDDNPISKFLAAFNPMLATFGTAASSANSQSQKLLDDIVKSTSTVPVGSPQLSVDSKSGAVSDDRLTNIFNMQKKLFELTRISAAAPQPAAPISQKLVQDIFKAVLVPVSSAKSAASDMCPRASEMAVSLSEDNSLSPSSPFNVDAASPLSGEIMSFSPPSIPDTSSPPPTTVKKSEKSKSTLESKGSTTQKSKSKDGKTVKSKPDEDAKDKKSKSDIQKLVVEEVKSIIRPFYSKGRINKDEYKEIMRKTVPSICNSKTQDFSKTRITIYVEAYIRKVQATRKYHAKKKDK